MASRPSFSPPRSRPRVYVPEALRPFIRLSPSRVTSQGLPLMVSRSIVNLMLSLER